MNNVLAMTPRPRDDRQPTPAEREVQRLRDQVSELEETVWQLREALAPAVAWPAEWRLTGKETLVLSALYACRGPYLSRESLLVAYDGFVSADDPPAEKIVDIYIHKLRAKLRGRVTIETHRGMGGWSLAPATRTFLKRVLAGDPVDLPPPPEPEPPPPPTAAPDDNEGERALTPAERRVVRGYGAVGLGVAAIVARTGFTRRQVKDALR
jgi:hypothetical protein